MASQVGRSATAPTQEGVSTSVAEDRSESSDDWKIAVGVVIPLVVLIGVLVGVYICYRKKYPVRMIIGREFAKFSNPEYSRSRNVPTLVREDANEFFSDQTSINMSTEEYNPVHSKIDYDNRAFVADDEDAESERERKFLEKKGWLFKKSSEEIGDDTTLCVKMHDAVASQSDDRPDKANHAHSSTSGSESSSLSEDNNCPDLYSSSRDKTGKGRTPPVDAGHHPGAKEHCDSDYLTTAARLFQMPTFEEMWAEVKARSRSMSLDRPLQNNRARSFSVDHSKSARKMSIHDETILAAPARALVVKSQSDEPPGPGNWTSVSANEDICDRSISSSSKSLAESSDSNNDCDPPSQEREPGRSISKLSSNTDVISDRHSEETGEEILSTTQKEFGSFADIDNMGIQPPDLKPQLETPSPPSIREVSYQDEVDADSPKGSEHIDLGVDGAQHSIDYNRSSFIISSASSLPSEGNKDCTCDNAAETEDKTVFDHYEHVGHPETEGATVRKESRARTTSTQSDSSTVLSNTTDINLTASTHQTSEDVTECDITLVANKNIESYKEQAGTRPSIDETAALCQSGRSIITDNDDIVAVETPNDGPNQKTHAQATHGEDSSSSGDESDGARLEADQHFEVEDSRNKQFKLQHRERSFSSSTNDSENESSEFSHTDSSDDSDSQASFDIVAVNQADRSRETAISASSETAGATPSQRGSNSSSSSNDQLIGSYEVVSSPNDQMIDCPGALSEGAAGWSTKKITPKVHFSDSSSDSSGVVTIDSLPRLTQQHRGTSVDLPSVTDNRSLELSRDKTEEFDSSDDDDDDDDGAIKLTDSDISDILEDSANADKDSADQELAANSDTFTPDNKLSFTFRNRDSDDEDIDV